MQDRARQSAQSQPSTANLACITVAYQPNISVLRRQLNQLPYQSLKIVIDNASDESTRVELRTLLSKITRTTFKEHPENIGLAAALNTGLELAEAHENITHVLLLDQDTEPTGWTGREPSRLARQLVLQDAKTGCVGPALIDPELGLQHGFHRARFGFWSRVNEPESGSGIVRCDSLNGSGTLMSMDLASALGGFDEAFFIDHVDTEWSFRVTAAGFHLVGVPGVRFVHRMGERSLRFWFFGWRLWPHRSAFRHYFLFRNAVRLLRRRYVPSTWKVWATAKLLLTAVVHGIADPERYDQLQAMARGARAGLKPDDFS